MPGVSLRTTMLVGYPGETEAEFEELAIKELASSASAHLPTAEKIEPPVTTWTANSTRIRRQLDSTVLLSNGPSRGHTTR